MTSKPDTYNYPAFDWTLEDGAYQRWLSDAPQLGTLAPPFELADLEGRHHRLTDFQDQPVVVEFGSYTCPIFCSHIPAMETLASNHPDAVFVVIYAREAHPGERVGAHRSVADKHAAARRLAATEPISRLILVDDLDGTVNRAYGAMWNSVFVLDGQGRVVHRRAWNDPDRVSQTLNGLVSGTVEQIESIEMSPPSGLGGFGSGLLRGGTTAVLDFYRSAPPPVRQMLETSASETVRAVVTADARTAHAGTAPAVSQQTQR